MQRLGAPGALMNERKAVQGAGTPSTVEPKKKDKQEHSPLGLQAADEQRGKEPDKRGHIHDKNMFSGPQNNFHGYAATPGAMGTGADFSFPGQGENVKTPQIPADAAMANYNRIDKIPFICPTDPTVADYTTGQFYFAEKKGGMGALRVYTLLGMNEILLQQAENAVLTQTTVPNPDDVQSRKLIEDAKFSTTVESFLEHFAPVGVGNGSPSPYTATGPLAKHTTRFASTTKMLPYVRQGTTPFPAVLFGGSVKTGQRLYLLLTEEPCLPGKMYVNSHGESRTSYVLKEGNSILTLQFYSNETNTPPQAIRDISFLSSETPKAPPRTSLLYLHTDSEGRKSYKKGAYWEIGETVHSYDAEMDTSANPHANWKNLPASHMIQVTMDLKGPFY